MTKEELAQLLQTALESAGADGLTGTEAARLIRSEYEKRGTVFRLEDFGARSIKELVCTITPAKVIGRAGMDVVFGPLGAAELPSPTPTGPNPKPWSPWRAWATPTSGRYVRVSPGGELTVEVGDGGVGDLARLSDAEHRAIAESFLSSEVFSDVEREEARAALREDKWWSRWVTLMRRDPARNTRWLVRRAKALEESLDQQIKRLGLREDARVTALENIRASRRADATSRGARRDSSKVQAGFGPHRATHDIAHRVLDHLTEAQVRALLVPLGAVLDAFER